MIWHDCDYQLRIRQGDTVDKIRYILAKFTIPPPILCKEELVHILGFFTILLIWCTDLR